MLKKFVKILRLIKKRCLHNIGMTLKICVLFNVAAYNSQAASEQNFESDEGLQKAMKKLQIIAGIFAHLKETAVVTIQRDPTPDLDPETLGILSGMYHLFSALGTSSNEV